MTQPENPRAKAVRLFQAVADAQVSESDFWAQMDPLFHEVDDPIIALAYEEAHHYWGNFHQRNVLSMRRKPDLKLVAQGRELFRTFARALEEHWPEKKVEEAMKHI